MSESISDSLRATYRLRLHSGFDFDAAAPRGQGGASPQLARLSEEQPAVRRSIDEEIEAVNSDPDRMDELLTRQNHRPAFRRAAISGTPGSRG